MQIYNKVLYKIFINVFNTIIENSEYFIQKREEKGENQLEKYKAKQFSEIITRAKPLENFDMNLFLKLVEKMTVYKEEKVTVTFLDGTEVECQIAK